MLRRILRASERLYSSSEPRSALDHSGTSALTCECLLTCSKYAMLITSCRCLTLCSKKWCQYDSLVGEQGEVERQCQQSQYTAIMMNIGYMCDLSV